MSLNTTIRLVFLCALFCAIDEVFCEKIDIPPPSRYDGKKALELMKRNRSKGGPARSAQFLKMIMDAFWELTGLNQGDILMPEWSPGRKGTIGGDVRWQNGVVPYYISPNFGIKGTKIIMSAMEQLESSTCIEFIPFKRGMKNWILITGNEPGCWSMVGRQNGGQNVNLGEGCLVMSVVLHELLHAIGLWHQQSSFDRDKYITIEWENVIEGMENMFDKHSSSEAPSFGVPYDYGSIMHFEAYAYSKNNRATIVAKHGHPRIGPGKSMTDSDVKKVRLMYNCDGMGANEAVMADGGGLRPMKSPPEPSPAHEPPHTATQHSEPSRKPTTAGTSRLSWYSSLSVALSSAIWTMVIVS